MATRFVIDNEDRGAVGGDWTGNLYDTEHPELDGERVEIGASPYEVLVKLLGKAKA